MTNLRKEHISAKAILLIIICSLFSGNLMAQKNLEAIKEKIGKEKNLKNSEVVKSSGVETASYALEVSDKLKREIMQAFDADQSDAERSVNKERSENNTKVISRDLSFVKDGIQTNYSVDIRGNDVKFNYRKVNNPYSISILKHGDLKLFSESMNLNNLSETILHTLNIDSLKNSRFGNMDSLRIHLENLDFSGLNMEELLNKVPKYIISENSELTINGEKLSAEEARKLGYNVITIPKLGGTKKDQEKLKFFIPKNGYIIINGEKLTAEEARKKGYDVETF